MEVAVSTCREVWMEGYAVTGNMSDAQLLFTHSLDVSFTEACEYQIAQDKIREDVGDKPKYGIERRAKDVYVIWGCRLFSKESDARKSFG